MYRRQVVFRHSVQFSARVPNINTALTAAGHHEIVYSFHTFDPLV